MTRATRFATYAAVATTVYLLLLYSLLPLPLVDEKTKDEVLPVIPWWLLVSFGSYSLWSLGHGLFTFRDCPEAYRELLQEIAQAKDELREHGVSVD